MGLITARGGSKGVPRKNLRLVGGKPLVAWTIEAALEARRLDRVVLSTDDDELASVGREWGAEVPFRRPAELAQDWSPHVDVVLHAVEWLAQERTYAAEAVMVLQPTTPFRASADIDVAVAMMAERGAPAVVGVAESPAHPFLTRRVMADGTVRAFVDCDVEYPRRQDLPPAFVVNGALYLVNVNVLRDTGVFDPEGTLALVMPQERSHDIDTEWDLRVADLLMQAGMGASGGVQVA